MVDVGNEGIENVGMQREELAVFGPPRVTEAVGLIPFVHLYDDVAYLEPLGILPLHQRHGIFEVDLLPGLLDIFQNVDLGKLLHDFADKLVVAPVVNWRLGVPAEDVFPLPQVDLNAVY